jgi:hypothetical protein
LLLKSNDMMARIALFAAIKSAPDARRHGLPRSRLRRGARDDEPAAFAVEVLKADN